MAATGTVSTGPSVCPVWTVTSTFSPFRAGASGLADRTVSGMNGVAPDPLPDAPAPALPEPDAPDAPDAPAEPDAPDAPPMFTTSPVGVSVVAVPISATVPFAWMPVTSS